MKIEDQPPAWTDAELDRWLADATSKAIAEERARVLAILDERISYLRRQSKAVNPPIRFRRDCTERAEELETFRDQIGSDEGEKQ